MAVRFRIFVSSPGDVAEERVLANRVIRRLADEFFDRVFVEPVFWEHEPLLATETFQSQIPRPSECQAVVCILWSRIGTRLPAQYVRPDGTPYSSGTDYEFEDAAEGYRRNGSPALLVYRKKTDPVVSLKDEQALLDRLKQKKALDAFCEKWFVDESDGTHKAASHSFRSADEFERKLEEHLRKLIAHFAPVELEIESHPPAKRSWTQGSPFRGLQEFDFEHAAIFFGRSKAIGELLDALRAQAADGRAFVLVLGASGSGKSSIVRAGLLPLLIQPGVVEGIAVWRRAIFRPSDAAPNPAVALATALVAATALPELVPPGSNPQDAIRDLAAVFRENPRAAFLPLKSILSQAAASAASSSSESNAPAPAARLIIIADQLEELFTLDGISDSDRTAFIATLSTLARSGHVWIVATLRSDFYPRVVELPELVALKEGAGQYDLLPPTPPEIAQMIRQPAAAAGLRFEEDPQTHAPLDDLLRDAAAASPEALPLLEFALDELFKRQTKDSTLTYEAFRAIGGVEGALSQRAEAVFTALPGDVRATLPHVFRALVTVGDGDVIARRQCALEQAARTPAAKSLVDALVRARLLVTDRSSEGDVVVRVSHEALLRNWPRLKDWLAHDRDLLRIRGRVSLAASRWHQESRRPDLLLPSGRSLDEARRLVTEIGPDLSAIEQSYIAASAARSRFARRLKRLAVAALIVLTILAGVEAWYANAQRRTAQARALEADRERKEAQRQAEIARDRFEDSWSMADSILFDFSDQLSNVPGAMMVREGLTRTALDYFDKLSSTAGDDPTFLRDLSAAYERLGDVLGAPGFANLGDTDAALDSYEKAITIAQKLADKSPADTGLQLDLAVKCGKFSTALLVPVKDTQQNKLNQNRAVEHSSKSVAICRELFKAHPKDRQIKRQLMISLNYLGNVLYETARIDDALAAYEESQKIAQQLAAAPTTNPAEESEAQRDLMIGFLKFSDIRLHKNDITGAIDVQQKALRIARDRDHSNFSSSQTRSDVANCLRGLGQLMRLNDEPGAAIQYEDEAIYIYRNLFDADSANRNARDMLYETLLAVANYYYPASPYTAVRYFHEAAAMDQGLLKIHPDDPEIQKHAIWTAERLAEMQARSNDPTYAIASFQMPITLGRKLADASPSDLNAWLDLTFNLTTLAGAYEAVNDSKNAADSYNEALSRSRDAMKRNPGNEQLLIDLVRSYQGLIRLQLKAQNPSAAADISHREIAEIQSLAAANPSNRRFQLTVLTALEDLGQILMQTDLKGALKAYNDELEASQKLLDADPNSPDLLRGFKNSLLDVGDCLFSDHQLPAALECYRKALPPAQKICDAAPGDLHAEKDLWYVHQVIGDALWTMARDKSLPEAQSAQYLKQGDEEHALILKRADKAIAARMTSPDEPTILFLHRTIPNRITLREDRAAHAKQYQPSTLPADQDFYFPTTTPATGIWNNPASLPATQTNSATAP